MEQNAVYEKMLAVTLETIELSHNAYKDAMSQAPDVQSRLEICKDLAICVTSLSTALHAVALFRPPVNFGFCLGPDAN